LVNSTLMTSSFERTRIMANSENEKEISLNQKQWGVMAGGSLVIFILCFCLLGLCCKDDPIIREHSSSLTKGLAENSSEL